MTVHESELLSQLVEISWEMDHTENPTIKMALNEQYWRVKDELIDSMGQDEYDNFIEMGRRMFS